MNLLFDIGHPGQVHLFRHAIRILKAKGHKVIVTVKDIPAAEALLNAFQIPWISLGRKFDSVWLKGFSQLQFNLKLYSIARREQIDLAIGSSITITHVSVFHKMDSIVLDDDDAEAVRLFSLFAHPFANCIISPAALSHQRTTKKDFTYAGTHELFYLHPEYFNPDPYVLKMAGIDNRIPYFILRFVSGRAYHDRGEKWMTLDQKLRLINNLKPYGNIYITTERKMEPELEQWRLKISPEYIHHLMFYATMFIGDSQTMTSEAAILGTPALKCNTFAHKLSIPNMLEDDYDLCYSYQPKEYNQFIDKIQLLLQNPLLKNEWKQKRERFLSETIDPTSFLVWFIENYPDSAQIMKENPDYQYRFK
jgi:uncharacterized protein